MGLEWTCWSKRVVRWLRDLSKIAGLDTPLVGEGHWRCDGIGVDMLEGCCGDDLVIPLGGVPINLAVKYKGVRK